MESLVSKNLALSDWGKWGCRKVHQWFLQPNPTGNVSSDSHCQEDLGCGDFIWSSLSFYQFKQLGDVPQEITVTGVSMIALTMPPIAGQRLRIPSQEGGYDSVTIAGHGSDPHRR